MQDHDQRTTVSGWFTGKISQARLLKQLSQTCPKIRFSDSLHKLTSEGLVVTEYQYNSRSRLDEIDSMLYGLGFGQDIPHQSSIVVRDQQGILDLSIFLLVFCKRLACKRAIRAIETANNRRFCESGSNLSNGLVRLGLRLCV